MTIGQRAFVPASRGWVVGGVSWIVAFGAASLPTHFDPEADALANTLTFAASIGSIVGAGLLARDKRRSFAWGLLGLGLVPFVLPGRAGRPPPATAPSHDAGPWAPPAAG